MKSHGVLRTLAAVGVSCLLVACDKEEPAQKAAEQPEASALALAVQEAGSPESAPAPVMETADQKLSYAIGFQMGMQTSARFKNDPVLSFDQALFQEGLKDALGDKASQVGDDEAQAANVEMQSRFEAYQAAQFGPIKAEGEAFLAQNALLEGVVTTDSGLQYQVLTKGESDRRPSASDAVTVHYHGTFIDGSVFDSSVEGGEPVSFSLSGVIPGWTEGLQLMAIGDKFRFVLPSDLAYGPEGQMGIPPHSVLIFEVELLGIN